MKSYDFVNRREYFQTLATLASEAKPGEAVAVAAMDIDPEEPAIGRLLGALRGAAERGAAVLLLVDAFNFLVDSHNVPGPLFYQLSLENFRGKYGRTMHALQSINEAGGTCFITNVPRRRFTVPQVGRSHIKGAVIGDRVFIGGCNLIRPKHVDIMVSFEDKKAAQTLHTWFTKMASAPRVREAFGDVDTATDIDAKNHLLLDAGVPGQSLIYDTALQLIDEAEKQLYITCQYFPGGQTAQHLAAAQERGVQVSIVYGHPRRQGTLSALHHIHQLAERTRGLPTGFFAGRLDRQAPKLHAKILASEKAAMVGSHNYVIQGVKFGTAELALHAEDPEFATGVRRYMEQQLHHLSK